MIGADPRSEMLFEMGQCAYRLGMAFGAAAEGAGSHAERLEYFELFSRCAFASRMSIALELRLRRDARAERRDGADAREHKVVGHEVADHAEERDPVERDPLETERYTEMDRERDREPVSLPVLLRTLNGVAIDAQALPGPPPAELPTLRELLARVTADTASAVEPRTGGALRARLAGSTTTSTFALAAAARPSPPGHRGALRRRPATGPPR